MQTYMRNMIAMAAAAVLAIVTLTATAQSARAQAAAAAPAQPAGKKAKAVKDTGEYDIYNEVIKDASPQGNPAACKDVPAAQAQQCQAKKFLADLDTWSQKYPDTEFKDVRIMYYVQGYANNNEAGKALDAAKPLVDKGIDGLKDGLDNDGSVLNLLFLTSRAAAAQAASGTPSAEQLATGANAAQLLSDFGKMFFAKDKKPATMADDQWADGLKQIEGQAQGTKFQIAMYPGLSIAKANTTKDANACASAEAAFRKTLQDYPEGGLVLVELAKATLCQQSVSPAKVPQALYLYARAVSMPVGGAAGLAAADQKNIDDYLKRAYTGYHGSDEGLADLKAMAAKSPAPPADFKIKTASQISAEAEEEFKTKNPQLAMWMGVKGKLADADGVQYFETSLKGTAMAGEGGAKLLKGKLLEAKPACRSKELLVAIPVPGQTGTPAAEITLKLAAPLTGKPEIGRDIQFNGAPSAFTKEPFMLTLDSEKADIDGLTVTPCTAAAPAPKKGVAAPAPKKK